MMHYELDPQQTGGAKTRHLRMTNDKWFHLSFVILHFVRVRSRLILTPSECACHKMNAAQIS
jgi:hypothetical protein